MRYGLDVANQGVMADPRRLVELAQAAEEAGWEGLFLWDHWGFAFDEASGDPWVMLAAVAQTTTLLRIGTAITPLPRRRPHMVASSVASLDLLSNGRMVFGAGLGGNPEEFSAFGADGDAKVRASMLDEGLDIVARMLAGERVEHQGQHYTLHNVKLEPRGVQQPRVPIWIGGVLGNALRRAARWDGWMIYMVNGDGSPARSFEDLAERLARVRQYREEAGKGMDGYEVVVMGLSRPSEDLSSYRAIGATWWLETLHGMRLGFDELMARVAAGPPS